MAHHRTRLILALSLIVLQLMLPAGSAVAQDGTMPGDTTQRVHVVQRGETLFRISVAYGVPMAWIVTANNILNPSHIEVGQRLIIPDSEPAAAVSPDRIVQHIVQRGEYLSQIAQRYGVSMWEIARANGISNPSLLYVGQVLTITLPAAMEPPASPAEPAAEPAPVPPPPPAGGSRDATYVVQRGDTLGAIARRYAITIAELASANGIRNPNLIYVGQVLTVPPLPAPPTPTRTEGKQIVVVLSRQRLYAFENGALVGEFVVSTGRAATPTVRGEFAIYLKLPSTRMRGPGYDLPNVPWTMYFYQGYGIHGTYWHNNFGTPMSHGCVNMRTEDARWLYDWAPMGTSVLVIP